MNPTLPLCMDRDKGKAIPIKLVDYGGKQAFSSYTTTRNVGRTPDKIDTGGRC